MSSINDSEQSHGTTGSPQETIEEMIYPLQVDINEKNIDFNENPKYAPSPKHEKRGWGSNNPINSVEEGQQLLDTGYRNGRQIYNVTETGKIVKFQPDNTPAGGYHAYEVFKPRDIPSEVLKQMLKDGRISKTEYNKLRKGKK